MIEVIPNWHPAFVHFPIALLTMSVVFFVMLRLLNRQAAKVQLRMLAYWNLWLGTGFAVIAAIAGWFAYNSVAHDTPSHEAMTDHRNWAIITVLVFCVLSAWSIKMYKSTRAESVFFTMSMLLAFVLLLSTGWRGSELVYRHGLGVMSLPKVDGEGHDHEHAGGHDHAAPENPVEVKSNMDNTSDAGVIKEEAKPVTKKNEHDHSTHKH